MMNENLRVGDLGRRVLEEMDNALMRAWLAEDTGDPDWWDQLVKENADQQPEVPKEEEAE